MNGNTVRISTTHEFPEPVVRAWMYCSVLRLLGFHSMQTRLTLIGLTGEDGRYICLQLFASGRLFEVIVGMWNLTEGELKLALNDLGRSLSTGAFDAQMLATAWAEIFEDSGALDVVAELKSVGVAVPDPDGLNLPIAPGKTLSDVLSIAAIEKSFPVVVMEDKIDRQAIGRLLIDQLSADEIADGETESSDEVFHSLLDELAKLKERVRLDEERSAASDPTGVKKKTRDLSIN